MGDTLERVRDLRALIRARESEIAEKRMLPVDIVQALRDAGAFRMPMPAAWGGPELPILEQIEVIEEASYANGSVGWCVMIGCDSGYYAAFLDDAVARAAFPSLDGVTAGLAQPATNAVKVDGGYRVSGRWKFGSGINHADHVVGGAIVVDEAGELLPGDFGMPRWRTLLLPRDSVEVLDTWHTTGLEGSGSNDYTVTDAFVPDEHALYILDNAKREGPLYNFLMVITKTAGVPIGIARRAIDDAVELATTKVVMPSMQLIRDEPRTQEAVAKAYAQVASARAFAWDAIGSLWATMAAGDEASAWQRAQVRLALHHAAFASRDAVAALYDTVTTSAVYQPNSIDQALRDLQTICQHVVLSSRNLAPAGRVRLGLDADAPLF